MKRFLCLLLCLMLLIPSVLAETDYSLQDKFNQQYLLTGNGVTGKFSLTAFGGAPWLEYLLPFAGNEMRIRLIHSPTGETSDMIAGDEYWQFQLYAQDAQKNAYGTTMVYGDEQAIYMSSELLPGELLTLPVGQDLLNAIFGSSEGNDSFYTAFANLMQIDDDDWAAYWEPVMEKYYTDMELWLSGYAPAPILGGTTGAMTMHTTYTIPADDLKAQMKKIVGLMIYDHDLQALLRPVFGEELASLYLNTALVYFYEACIDLLPLSGSVVLEREMTVLGEVVGTSFSLPLADLPQDLVDAAGSLLSAVFALPEVSLPREFQRITVSQSQGDVSVMLSAPTMTYSVILDETASNAETSQWEGYIRINPAAGVNEAPLSAAFTMKTSHAITTDDEGITRDSTSFSLAIAPDLSMLEEDDPFRNSYIDFAPVSLDYTLRYASNDSQMEPTQINVTGNVKLPDAEVGLDLVVKTTAKWDMPSLPTAGAENVLAMSDARAQELLARFVSNATITMATMNAGALPTATPEPATLTDIPEPVQTAEPTAVPPM
ncbi:MAG: hypothetical protein IJ438_04570 [Clostridia bacterium]|nr:hypothetical protein [Clostridia bacterium]